MGVVEEGFVSLHGYVVGCGFAWSRTLNGSTHLYHGEGVVKLYEDWALPQGGERSLRVGVGLTTDVLHAGKVGGCGFGRRLGRLGQVPLVVVELVVGSGAQSIVRCEEILDTFPESWRPSPRAQRFAQLRTY